MVNVENVNENGTVVFMDGKFFINCRYTKCTLVFTGGDFGWIDSKFDQCNVRFEGPANRAIKFAQAFNIVSPEFVNTPKPSEKSGDT